MYSKGILPIAIAIFVSAAIAAGAGEHLDPRHPLAVLVRLDPDQVILGRAGLDDPLPGVEGLLLERVAHVRLDRGHRRLVDGVQVERKECLELPIGLDGVEHALGRGALAPGVNGKRPETDEKHGEVDRST